MNEYAYYNGVFTPYDAASIPLSDRSIFFGDAVYDVVVGRGKRLYQFDEHIARLFKNARTIGLEVLPEKEMITEAAEELLELAQADEFMLYIQLSSDAARRKHSRENTPANLLMTVTECELPSRLSEIRAITLPDMRHRFCDIKTTSLLPAVLSVEEARRRGADIAIFHKNGTVTECSYANVSMLKDGKVITHPFDCDILPGITQVNLESAAEKLGIAHESREFTVEELHSADAVMISSTTKLIKVCTELDGVSHGISNRYTVEALFDVLRDDMRDIIG
jgi:D-alanine transaminase